MAEKKKAFSLAEAMRDTIGSASTTNMGVSNLDTGGREQIEYIPRTALVADDKNFYSLDGIDELAASIELIGVQQPLRVRPIEGENGLYRIVSGHRRRAALDKLALDGNRDFESVPCIVERDNVSPAMQELRLIYANSDTRRMKDADLAKQAERVTELLYQLKEEGVEFPGRMRDHVAEACKTSKTKLATLQAARKHLIPLLREMWEDGRLNTSQAMALYQAAPDVQHMALSSAGAANLRRMTAAEISSLVVEIVRNNNRREKQKVQAEQPKEQVDTLTDYLEQRHKEDKTFLWLCRTEFLKIAAPKVLFAETRQDGIKFLKDTFGKQCAYLSNPGGFKMRANPKGIQMSDNGGTEWIERTWTETWDALAVAALIKCGGGKV